MTFVERHSLSLVSAGVALLWVVCYVNSDPSTHWGSFFGNAIADWVGLVVTVLATKHLYEKPPRKKGEEPEGVIEVILDHKVTVFLIVTGVGWVVVYLKMYSEAKWGQVVGNLVSEWTQNLGFVLLTKKFIERSAIKHREAKH